MRKTPLGAHSKFKTLRASETSPTALEDMHFTAQGRLHGGKGKLPKSLTLRTSDWIWDPISQIYPQGALNRAAHGHSQQG
jgi:hypothetical protein